MSWIPVMEKRASRTEVEGWDIYQLMNCIEAIFVASDCNDLDKRPPMTAADVARVKSGKGTNKIRLRINGIPVG